MRTNDPTAGNSFQSTLNFWQMQEKQNNPLDINSSAVQKALANLQMEDVFVEESVNNVELELTQLKPLEEFINAEKSLYDKVELFVKYVNPVLVGQIKTEKEYYTKMADLLVQLYKAQAIIKIYYMNFHVDKISAEEFKQKINLIYYIYCQSTIVLNEIFPTIVTLHGLHKCSFELFAIKLDKICLKKLGIDLPQGENSQAKGYLDSLLQSVWNHPVKLIGTLNELSKSLKNSQLGKEIVFSTDKQGNRIVSETDKQGNKIEFCIDELGNRTVFSTDRQDNKIEFSTEDLVNKTIERIKSLQESFDNQIASFEDTVNNPEQCKRRADSFKGWSECLGKDSSASPSHSRTGRNNLASFRKIFCKDSLAKDVSPIESFSEPLPDSNSTNSSAFFSRSRKNTLTNPAKEKVAINFEEVYKITKQNFSDYGKPAITLKKD